MATQKIVTDISAVRLFVSDLGRAIDFYTSTLGLDLTIQDDASYALFQLPNVTLLVERVDSGDEEFRDLVGRFSGVSLTTYSISAAFERLSAAGVRFDGPPELQPWGGTLAHFHDPDNNVLTLVEAPGSAT